MKNKILIIGANGLLGSKLKYYFPNCLCPTSEELNIKCDIRNSNFYKKNDCKNIKQVIHCAAIKNLEFCEFNKIEATKVNILGTINVAFFCNEINAKLIYISTDYVFKGTRGNYKTNDEVGPINFYGETKLAGEIISKSIKNHLIIRLSFCEDVFPYEKAYSNQITTKITVSEAALRIHKLIKENSYGVQHLPGVRQSVYNFAKKSKKDVKKIYLENKSLPLRPKNSSLSIGERC
jgi:dTDP-4-dehydrorhamnose reductase